ncbi:MAG: hypothetical protein Kow0074_12530 [Candidatus Zixiibacteriota bacterium]
MAYDERLHSGVMTASSSLSRYDSLSFAPDFACNNVHPDSVWAISADGFAPGQVVSSPEALLFLRSACGPTCGDELPPGYDVDGSLVIYADIGLVPGTFEIDTTCTAEGYHPTFFNRSVPQPVSFTKGVITVIGLPIDTFHVDPGGSDITGDGSLLHPYQTIQKAVEVAPITSNSSAVILVHPGVYKGPVLYPTGFGLTIASSDGPHVTHIVGDSSKSVVRLDAGNDTDHQVLDGFTIRDNFAPIALESGGIAVSSPTWATIRNCIVRNNVSSANTAGIDFRGSRGLIANNWIVENRVQNPSPNSVAGVFLSGGASVEFVNNTIARNRTAGSAIFETSAIRIGSSTQQNTAEIQEGRPPSQLVYRAGESAVLATFDNNIIADNGPAPAYIHYDPPGILFYNNLFSGNGNGNDPGPAPFDAASLILDPPDFLDTARGNYHIRCSSPALNNGRVESVPLELTRDIDGQSRFGPGIQPVDIGADEYQEPPPVDFDHTVLESTCEHLLAEFAAIDDPGFAGFTWYFGDGDSAVGRIVEHEYLSSGLFSVQLKVNTTCGPDSVTKPGVIQVTGPFTTDFDADVRSGCDSIDVVLTGTTTAAVDTFIWDFGDNTPRDTVVVNGVEASVLHRYKKIGTCTVTLFAINECRTDTVIKPDFIEIKRVPNVFITSSYDTASGPFCNPYTVEFSYTTTESLSAFLWEFGDNTTSTEPNPIHTYQEGGRTYSVRLTATGECGSDVVARNNYITLTKRPTAVLTVDTTVACAGTTPLTFSASVDGTITSSLWQFGDEGSVPGVNAQHTYDVPGEYVPRFIMTHGCGTDTVMLADTISVGLPPIAAFTASALSGFEPLAVTFTDQSENAPTEWSWLFGDGEESEQPSPTHTYDTTGRFNVRLAIRNSCGVDTVTLGQSVVVGGFTVSVDSTGVDGDTIKYAVDVDSSVLLYDNPVSLNARLTTTPRRGSLTFALGQATGTPPFNTTLRAIPSRDLASGSYTIELTADDPARITKTATHPLSFTGVQFISVSVDTLTMDSTIISTASSKTITIRNNAPPISGIRVVVQEPRIVGSSVYSVLGQGRSLAPQQDVRWDVLFEPRAKGTFTTTLQVVSDDPAAPNIVIPIVGRGIGEQSPPRLISSIPDELRIDLPIEFEFSEPIIPNISDTFMTVHSGAGVLIPGERTWRTNRILRFTPDDYLPPDDTLSVLLRAVITDTNGNFYDGNGNGSEEGSPVDDATLSIPTGPGVYPGDANNDGAVNEGDVIALGRYNEMSGDPRPPGPPGFSLQPAIAWDVRAATYADADGDGDVDSMDICPIAEFFDREVSLPKTVVEVWLNEARGWTGDFVSSLRAALEACPNAGSGQDVLRRFLDELGGGAPLPTAFRLEQNFPNPFNPSTLIQYDLRAPADVKLEVFDIMGRTVSVLHDGYQEAGRYSAVWDGRDRNGHSVASGIYFYRLTTPSFQAARKMVLLK